jgi:hypothetical protein
MIGLEPAMIYRLDVTRPVAFDTAAERYAWLMESLFIARGRLLGAKALEYDVYRVR